VLRWQAAEAAELLDTSVAAINSALQRARATMGSVSADSRPTTVGEEQRDLLARYVDAFQSYDMDRLVKVLHEDAIQSMPPFAMWLRGAGDITRFMLGPGAGCRGSVLIPVAANGSPAFGQYKPDPEGGYSPWALQVVEISGDRIVGLNFFLDTEHLFPAFGLPDHLPPEAGQVE